MLHFVYFIYAYHHSKKKKEAFACMKAGLAVRHLCWPSPSVSGLAQF